MQDHLGPSRAPWEPFNVGAHDQNENCQLNLIIQRRAGTSIPEMVRAIEMYGPDTVKVAWLDILLLWSFDERPNS